MWRPVFPISGIALILGFALPPIPNLDALRARPDDGPLIVRQYVLPAEAGITASELRARLDAIPEDSPVQRLGMAGGPDGRHAIAMFVPERHSPHERLVAVRGALGIDEIESRERRAEAPRPSRRINRRGAAVRRTPHGEAVGKSE